MIFVMSCLLYSDPKPRSEKAELKSDEPSNSFSDSSMAQALLQNLSRRYLMAPGLSKIQRGKKETVRPAEEDYGLPPNPY